MPYLLWLTIAFPLAGFVALVLYGRRCGRRTVGAIGAGSVGLAAAASIWLAVIFVRSPQPNPGYSETLWNWITVGSFHTAFTLYLDPLSLVMVLVVTCVGFLIHLYSVEFMEPREQSRFFAYMNLFVASMVILVLAGDFLLFYLGWEGVGLCSYLLIGFWYEDPANGRAARKAFITTRVGDVSLAVALFLIFQRLGTLNMREVFLRAGGFWSMGSAIAIAVAALILGGAVGKSAQLPLQTWLPDAMAGPTPTSALIHAATMVTAGVYLIARSHALFALAPPVQTAVAVVGALTLLIAGFSAFAQNDIKRILAYSTISQIGYMFMALGAGAWAAAVFHLVTHAFFKALLFMAAGLVIYSLDHEHDIFRMGGLRRELPLAFWSFVIGGSALAGLPLITAGFYSKDLILWQSGVSVQGSTWLWAAGILGVFLTSLYIYRLIFVVFFGPRNKAPSRAPGWAMWISCAILCGLSLVGGFIDMPEAFGGSSRLSFFLYRVFPTITGRPVFFSEITSSVLAAIVFFMGLWIAYVFFLRARVAPRRLPAIEFGQGVYRLWKNGWGFDWLYERALIHPFLVFARIDRRDIIDSFFNGIGAWTQAMHRALRLMQTGSLRWYAVWIAAGAVVFIAVRYGA